MNEQLFQALPIYQPMYPTNYFESLKAPETAPWYSMEQIGSVESLPTNKATNVRNDGSLARHSPKRLSCHLDFLETPLKDMTDNNTVFPTTKTHRGKLVDALESPLLRKIKGTKTPEQDAAVTKNQSYKTNHHKLTKDKSVELYKTEWCRNWQELGVCRYDKKCRYAHSASELRKIERHPRYKTQICRTYHDKGTCPYGVRCTFIHEQQSMANPNTYHHQEATTHGNSPSCEQQQQQNFKTAVKTDATTPDDPLHHQGPAGMPWLSDTLLEQQSQNETKERMSLSQIKNVVHSRSASTPNTCWSPTTMNNSLWGPYEQTEPNANSDLAKRQKRSSSIASMSSFESSIFAGDDNGSPEFDRPTIYRQEHTGYISPTIEDSFLSDFGWMSLKPDLLKPHTTGGYLTNM
ncbi:hypothetical protein INT44_007770 [Umbelopsis vinacea]|uniref:C3H1-type domain-containing protein n=1 Tax=Umbelopsis vinacea TaxID=44442 RepID=A0A8H7UBB4_9FUNG|nr:hypothetical protein INT44_007770 [Umbelopsis vinacea]